MTHMPRSIVVLLAAVVVAAGACGTTPSADRGAHGPDVISITTAAGSFMVERHREPGARSDRIDAAPRDVFAVLPAVYEDLGIPVGTLDRTRLVFGNNDHRASRNIAGVRMSRFLDCGRGSGLGPDLADSAPVQLSILTRVEADGPEGSRLTTDLSASARAVDGTGTARAVCTTTGVLEGLIAAMAERHLSEP